LINGYDCLNITKLDILDELSEIKVAIKYLVDRKELPGFPGSFLPFPLVCCLVMPPPLPLADLDVLSKVEVEYVTLPGWGTPITSITSYDALPDNCKKYVKFIEEFMNVPVEWIGVGPGRESMLKK
jgi:adenylosuccinate synthase